MPPLETMARYPEKPVLDLWNKGSSGGILTNLLTRTGILKSRGHNFPKKLAQDFLGLTVNWRDFAKYV